MPLLILLIFATTTYYRESITNVDSYSIYTNSPSVTYDLIVDEQSDLGELRYIPHVSSFLGLSTTVNNITFSASYQNEDEDKKSVKESDLFDFQVAGVYNNFLWHLFYQNYHGLYITDSEIKNSDLPRANSSTFGLGIKRFTKDNYKAVNSLSNYSNKKITNWSWFQGLNFSKFRLYSDETLIPDQYTSKFSQIAGLESIESTNLGVEFGITALYNYKRFFIDFLVGVGLALQKQEFTGIKQEGRVLTDNSSSVIVDLGYDANLGSFGANLQTDSVSMPVKNVKFKGSRSVLTLYYKYFF